jgi:hypothetical protein
MSAAENPPVPDLRRLLQHEVEAHPYRTVAIAAGLGYLLGTRFAGPLIGLLTSRMGVQLASSLLAPLAPNDSQYR